jgi:hypothetical protein
VTNPHHQIPSSVEQIWRWEFGTTHLDSYVIPSARKLLFKRSSHPLHLASIPGLSAVWQPKRSRFTLITELPQPGMTLWLPLGGSIPSHLDQRGGPRWTQGFCECQ